MGALDRAPHVELEDRAGWRRWLEENHATATGAWLVAWRPSAGRGGVTYEESVEEALCFGWIDGQVAGVDEQRSRQYFAPRRPGSPWSSSNKERVERLTRAGLMAPAGLASVERAKADGSWSILDAANRLELPADLESALAARPPARANWDAFPASARRQMLGWIALAKRDETRAGRIEKTADAAQRNVRAIG
jgi:uncharacterized protein YdeI (YjbR/CyaY-like superfamily)